MILYYDSETYSPVPIKNGTHAYAEQAEVIMHQWAVDDGPVQVGGWDMAGVVQNLVDQAERVVVHNSRFDRIVGQQAKGGVTLPVSKLWDTMAQARTVGLPGALATLCDILGVPVDKAKDKAGKGLIRTFCMPTRDGGRNTPKSHPVEWSRFLGYGKLDVEAMREVYKRLPVWNYRGAERKLWELDQRINDRGFAIDLDFARAALDAVELEQKRLKREVQEATDGAIESATQRGAIHRRLQLLIVTSTSTDFGLADAAGRELGGLPLGFNDPDREAEYEEALRLALPDLQKGTLERRLDDPDLPDGTKQLIAIRLEASTTSTAKFKRLLACTSSDGRLRAALEFCGAARTGRWSGRLFQPQNLPRPKHTAAEIEETIEAVKAGCADMLYDDVIARCSSALRGCIVPARGKKLVAADLANIEGRVLAWLAGEGWKLQAFRAYDAGTGPDLYILAYARAFGLTVEEVEKAMRQIGKVMELALGYQGAVGAFSSMAALYGVELPEEKVIELVKAWRKANAKIVQFWYGLENAAKDAVDAAGHTFQVGQLKLRRDGNWLRIQLPSGRALCYPSPRIVDGQLSYMGVNQYTRKWERILTYGGKLAENVTQAVARDVMADAMLRAEESGFKVVLTVHDELVTEAEPDRAAAELEVILSTNPQWADGLPLAAEGFEAHRYGK